MNSPLIIIGLIILGIIIFGYVIILIIKPKKLSKKQQTIILTHWSRIITEPDKQKALLEADKLLDKTLHLRGKNTGSLGEKLKREAKLFEDINGVWWAHKLRNQLAHELNQQISDKDYSKALKIYEKALRDLGMNQ